MAGKAGVEDGKKSAPEVERHTNKYDLYPTPAAKT
jgi:hypothetical protein